MKKFVLTYVLALAACGGGSGGNGVISGTTEFERVAASNAKITGMVSRIKSGDLYSNLSRSAKTQRVASGSNNITGTVFLNNVLFESADKEYGPANEDFTMRFSIKPNGEIDGLDIIDDATQEVIKRVDEENRFTKQDFDENGNVTADVSASVTLLGQEKGLKYSDFGFVNVNGIEYNETENTTTTFIMPIAGGYDVKNITDSMNANNLSNDIVFNGIAVAGVGEPNTQVGGPRLTLRDNNATLTFAQNSGNEVFSANFAGYTDSKTGVQYNDWYKVVATKYNSGEDAGKAEIAFTVPSGRDIPVGFEATNSGKVENNNISNQLSVGFNYYGDSANNPNEATGIIHYQCTGCKPFLMGFGGKAQ